MKIELDFIPVEEKLPDDVWRKKEWWRGWCEKYVFDEVFAIVDNDDPADDPEICIVAYYPVEGFAYQIDHTIKYDGNPWRVTHWAFIPDIEREINNS